MNPIDPGAATGALIAAWGAPGAIIVILLIAAGWLAWWLYSSAQSRIAEANKRTDDVRKDLDEKYKDAEQTRDVLRELKGSIDLNTRTLETALTVLKARS